MPIFRSLTFDIAKQINKALNASDVRIMISTDEEHERETIIIKVNCGAQVPIHQISDIIDWEVHDEQLHPKRDKPHRSPVGDA